MYFKKTLLLFSIAMLWVATIVAQVTIGSDIAPLKGALLDLKEYSSDPVDGTTATKGLGLPRVDLVSNSSLVPLVSAEEAVDNDVKKNSMGLFLFNVGKENTESIEAQLCKGLHVWNGKKWIPMTQYPKSILGESVIRCQEGPGYTVVAGSIKVYGLYEKGTVLDNTHYIEVTISSPADIIGGEYILQTYSTTTNEIKYEARGIITSAQQVVKLQGIGAIETAGDKHFVLITNSPSEKNRYPIVVGVTLPLLRIVGVGTADYQPASKYIYSRSYHFMNNPNAFGDRENSVVKTKGFNFESYITRTSSEWIQMFKSKPDVVIRSYHTTMADDVGPAIKEYLEAGGVFIEFNDNLPTASNASVRALYGSSASSNIKSSAATGQLMLINNVDDEIVKGPWGDMAGKFWSEDASETQGISGVPLDRIIVYSQTTTNSQSVVAFRDKKVNYFYLGDGGFLSGYVAATSCCYPFQLNVDRMPTTGYQGKSHNSAFFGNIITWAIKQAATNGINKH